MAKEIDLEDVYENMGARMVREVASQDQRRRRRRHHHRHAPGRGHLQRRPAGRRCRRQSRCSSSRAWKRPWPTSPRSSRSMSITIKNKKENGPGRHRGRQQRHRDRRAAGRRHGEGRQGRRDHRRRRQEPEDRSRMGRGHAVRPRLSLALLRHRSAEDGMRAGRRLRPDLREEDLQHQGTGPGAGEGGQRRQAAVDRRRRRRGRGPGHAGHQQAARHVQGAPPSRPPATATAARPCSKTSPS